MSSKEKLLKRLQQIPSDFTFKELQTLLECLGYHQINGAGSSVKFVKGKIVIAFHKPHPSNVIKKYILKSVLLKLEEEMRELS